MIAHRTIFLLLILFLPTILFGQLPKTPPKPTHPNQFRLELLKPDFEFGGYSFATSVLFISIRQAVEGPVSVELELPIGYVRDRGWELRVANPYLGLTWESYERPARLAFGVRAPILPDGADVRILRIADMDRYEAFTPDLWTFSVGSIVGADSDPLRAKGGLNLWVPLHSAMEVVTNYSLTVQKQVVNLLAGLEIRGRAALSGRDLVFGERTRHELGASFEFLGSGVRPGVVVRRPIQGRDVVDWVYGITILFQ